MQKKKVRWVNYQYMGICRSISKTKKTEKEICTKRKNLARFRGVENTSRETKNSKGEKPRGGKEQCKKPKILVTCTNQNQGGRPKKRTKRGYTKKSKEKKTGRLANRGSEGKK